MVQTVKSDERAPAPAPRQLTKNDLDWFAARLSVAVYDTNREFREMSVQDLKLALRHIPGSEGLTVNYAPEGDMRVTIAGRTVEVRPDASNAEIVAAFANPSTATSDSLPPVTLNPTPITTISPVAIPSPIGTKTMSITGAAPAAMSLKDLIGGARNTVSAAHDKLRANAAKVTSGAAALDGLADDLGKEADDLMAMIGQFKNSLGGENA